MAAFNKSEIFRNAWTLVKKAGKTLSDALKNAWAKAKNAMTFPSISSLENSFAQDLLNCARLALKEAGVKVQTYYGSKKDVALAAEQGIGYELTEDSEFALYGVFVNGVFAFAQGYQKTGDKSIPLQSVDIKTWDVAEYNAFKTEF